MSSVSRPSVSGPEVIKRFFTLNSAEQDIFPAHNDIEMPKLVGISNLMSRKNSIPGLSEPEKCLIS